MKRSKHIDIKHHYLREKFKLGKFNLKAVPTGEQAADFLLTTT